MTILCILRLNLSIGLSRGPSEGEAEMKIGETLEMAYPQKLARDIIIGIADPIDEDLVKLSAFEFDPPLRHHFRAELRSWLNKIQRIRHGAGMSSARNTRRSQPAVRAYFHRAAAKHRLDR
jgi:hypothetical protein